MGKTTTAVTQTRIIASAISSVAQINHQFLESISDIATPGVVDDAEAIALQSQIERLRINLDALCETLSGGGAHNMAIELDRAGDAIENVLSAREMGVLTLIALGRCNKEIATALEISINTVDNHRASIAHKIHGIIGRHPSTMDLSRSAHLAGALGSTQWMQDLLRKAV
jgi:DNA-binding NarL/FixJ family response regulator